MRVQDYYSLFVEDVYEIIEKKVKTHIINEIIKCHILNEFDFQCKFVSLLKDEIDTFKDARWNIYNTFYLKASKKIPDILIFLNYTPIIFIEVKYYGFNNPNKEKIYRDLTKLHNYFFRYSLSLKRGYTYNIFSYSKKKSDEFERSLINKINQKDIKVVNLNLKELKEFDKIKAKVLNTIARMRSNLRERTDKT